jgi:hypothetical protein
MKNVSSSRGGDDEDPLRPFRQVKGKTVCLEQHEGKKKRRMDRAARAALAAAAAAEQVERGGQLQISSDQIAYRVRHLASRPRSTAPPLLPPLSLLHIPLHRLLSLQSHPLLLLDYLIVSTWFLRGPRGSDTLAWVLQRGLGKSADSSIPRQKIGGVFSTLLYIPHLIQAFYFVQLFSK